MDVIHPTELDRAHFAALEKDLDAILHDPVMPVPACGVMAFRDGKLLYQGCKGHRRIDAEHPESDLPFEMNTLSHGVDLQGLCRARRDAPCRTWHAGP